MAQIKRRVRVDGVEEKLIARNIGRREEGVALEMIPMAVGEQDVGDAASGREVRALHQGLTQGAHA